MKYTAHMWPFFLYSSTQYGRAAAASCVPRMHKSQFDREKGVWGNSLFSELCLYSLGLPFYVGKGWGQKLLRHNYYCSMRCGFLAFLPWRWKYLSFSQVSTLVVGMGREKNHYIHITYLGVLAARELILWIHSIWQSHSNGLSDSEISVYPWSTKKMS